MVSDKGIMGLILHQISMFDKVGGLCFWLGWED